MDLVRLNDVVSLLRPQFSSSKGPEQKFSNTPETIILLTWMDASLKHVLKYALHYREVYPGATILLISSSYHDFIYRPRSTQRANLQPAIPHLTNKSHTGKTLVHLFSNGGGLNLVNLCELYVQTTGRQLPIQALVLDSCPGRATFSRGSAALLQNLPKQQNLQVLMTALLYPLLVLFWLCSQLQPQNILETVREGLNDPGIVTTAARRMYVYSMQDKIVDYEDVEDHIDEARQVGYKADVLCFEIGDHVGHLKNNGKAYWEAIESLWDNITHNGRASDDI
jgi:hypothetical protein